MVLKTLRSALYETYIDNLDLSNIFNYNLRNCGDNKADLFSVRGHVQINSPLALCHWKKNLNVRSRPITQARPDRNKICHKKML